MQYQNMTMTAQTQKQGGTICPEKNQLLMELTSKISQLSTKMSSFEERISSKIDILENNYSELNGKIEQIEKI